MLFTKSYFEDEPICKVIGPQIGPIFETNGVHITIAFPHRTSLDKITCVVREIDGSHQIQQTQLVLDPVFRHFLFTFPALKPESKYNYYFMDLDQNILDLEGGLREVDCWFIAPHNQHASPKFVMASCNNPFTSGKKAEQRYLMWERLYDTLIQDESIKLLIQAGDQVYHDEIEEESLAALRASQSNEADIVAKVIRNYQHFMGNLTFRLVLAQIPSVAMLDDHDITDGWGGRPESFMPNGAFKLEWKRFFAITYKAFQCYQAVKNPDPLVQHAASCYFTMGENAFVLLDLRAEKNVKQKKLMSDLHLKGVLKQLAHTPAHVKNVFILMPVVPVRIDPKKEAVLEKLAKESYRAKQYALHTRPLAFLPFMWKKMIHLIQKLVIRNPLADLADDVTDGLTAKVNKPYLLSLLYFAGELIARQQKRVVLLSGDIHSGGISELLLQYKNGQQIVIPQVVSSPIANKPMSKKVNKLITASSQFIVNKGKSEKPTIHAFNRFYTSKRNFVVVNTNLIEEKQGIKFYFEGKNPFAYYNAYSLNQSIMPISQAKSHRKHSENA